jgi:hypothetical protein
MVVWGGAARGAFGIVPAGNLSQSVIGDHKGIGLRSGQVIEAELATD